MAENAAKTRDFFLDAFSFSNWISFLQNNTVCYRQCFPLPERQIINQLTVFELSWKPPHQPVPRLRPESVLSAIWPSRSSNLAAEGSPFGHYFELASLNCQHCQVGRHHLGLETPSLLEWVLATYSAWRTMCEQRPPKTVLDEWQWAVDICNWGSRWRHKRLNLAPTKSSRNLSKLWCLSTSRSSKPKTDEDSLSIPVLNK